jgi:hypothetical protein
MIWISVLTGMYVSIISGLPIRAKKPRADPRNVETGEITLKHSVVPGRMTMPEPKCWDAPARPPESASAVL